ncbi:MAG TPA: altronate dehydratase family protein [Acidothermaceae bacterium]
MSSQQLREVVISLHDEDSVGIARRSIAAGTSLVGAAGAIRVPVDVPAGHKVALAEVRAGEPVRKYGQPVGVATQDIHVGDHVHSHNLSVSDFVRDYAYGADAVAATPLPAGERATFQGIVRPDGRVATRNFIGILTSVNCSATAAKLIAKQFGTGSPLLAPYEQVDGVVALTHGSGCGMAASGEGMDILRRTLSGYARHPNFAGLLVIGLGCEVNQINELTQGFEIPDHVPVVDMTIQDLGGTRATVNEGVARVRDMLSVANEARRTPVPASELVLGLQCGGSDGYSGITANPALGVASDLLVRHGGTSILGETPEVYGAEHLLTRRAVSEAVGRRLVDRIEWWERYVAASSGSMDNNPSPGNKAGGLTTILEKSLGAVAKGGRANLSAVYEYAEAVEAKGFVFMDTPGYDPVSVTGMVAGGANIVCFTTGRGSVFGCKPVPSLKLATNSDVYRRMVDDMDLNCGEILDGGATVEEMGRRIFQRMLEVASGTLTKSEEIGLGDEEFTPWQLGAVM